MKKVVVATGATILLGALTLVVVGLLWIQQVPPAPSQKLDDIATQLIGGSLTLGALILVFLTFNFAMMKFYDTSDKMQKLYSWSSFGIFTSGTIAILDSSLFTLYRVSQNVVIFSASLLILFVSMILFLISVGAMVLQQLAS